MVKKGERNAPILIGRDHRNFGLMASPNRETEVMKDGSEAIADRPILNALINSLNMRHYHLCPQPLIMRM